MGSIGTWQLIIVLAIVFLLFGAKRLPEAARGLGRSLKIFKSETEGLITKDDKRDDITGEATNTQAQQPAPRAVEPTAAPQQQAAPQQPADPANDQRRDA